MKGSSIAWALATVLIFMFIISNQDFSRSTMVLPDQLINKCISNWCGGVEIREENGCPIYQYTTYGNLYTECLTSVSLRWKCECLNPSTSKIGKQECYEPKWPDWSGWNDPKTVVIDTSLCGGVDKTAGVADSVCTDDLFYKTYCPNCKTPSTFPDDEVMDFICDPKRGEYNCQVFDTTDSQSNTGSNVGYTLKGAIVCCGPEVPDGFKTYDCSTWVPPVIEEDEPVEEDPVEEPDCSTSKDCYVPNTCEADVECVDGSCYYDSVVCSNQIDPIDLDTDEGLKVEEDDDGNYVYTPKEKDNTLIFIIGGAVALLLLIILRRR